MNLTQEQTIWYPGIYDGRQGDYAKIVAEVPEKELIQLVQTRAQEDGEWAIENDFVGDNENVMRKMMEWVSNPENIRQCVEHVHKEEMENVRTVDWVCRDLANASKWIGGSRD